jgi:hypothetical protein
VAVSLPGTPRLVRPAWISAGVGDQAQSEVRAATSYWREADPEPPYGELRVLGVDTYGAAALMARLVRIPLDVNTWEA